MIDRKDITIIVPTLNGGKDALQTGKIHSSLELCLTSLYETEPDIPILITSNKGDPKVLPSGVIGLYSRINSWEQGQCKAVNAAAVTVRTKWLFITNDDMVYGPGWLDRLTEGMGDKLCMSPVLVEPGLGAPSFIRQSFGGNQNFKKEDWNKFSSEHEDKRWETGFNLPYLIRSDLWYTIGGYDVSYDPWGSNGDSDLQAKVHLAGVQTMRNRNALVYHFSQTSGTFHPDQRPYWRANFAYFIKKWGYERVSGDDVWYSRNIVDEEKLTFKPTWRNKYK